jgi:3-deoxy-D-manno-octulosonic-acid transferase
MPVIVAGSTHHGEEQILLNLLAARRAQAIDAFLVIAPRDVTRASYVVELGRKRELRVMRLSEVRVRRTARGETMAHTPHKDRSTSHDTDASPPECLVLDTMGDLEEFYALATVSFVGKSLVGYGGHNPLEPLAAGCPVIFGPSMQNFEAITRQLLAAGAAVQVRDPGEFEDVLRQLLADPAVRERIVTAAHRVLQENAGATERTVRALHHTLPSSARAIGPNCEASPI